jgi:hypothetical protein
MAEEIVACPGCGKKFRIPEGAPGGNFQCTACNASVPYGKSAAKGKAAAGAPAAKGAKAAAAAPAGRAAAAPAGRSARAAAPAAAPSRAAASGRRRGRAEEEEPEERGRGRGAPKKPDSSKVVLWSSIGVLVLVGAVAAVWAMKKNAPTEPPPKTTATAPAATAPAAEPQPAPAAPTTALPPAPAAEPPKPPESSGIGAAKTNVSSGPVDLDALFSRIPDVPDVTPQEREVMDRDVALVTDFNAGKDSNDAYNRLRKGGRKSVPAVLSAFSAQWKASKWEADMDKWASHRIQKLLIDIAKADRPGVSASGEQFEARYVPQDPKSVPATDFQRAARMWVRWWNETGHKIEKFKDWAE